MIAPSPVIDPLIVGAVIVTAPIWLGILMLIGIGISRLLRRMTKQ